MTRKLFYCLLVVFMLTASLPVFAENEAVPFSGDWVLDKVYENASSSEKYVLDPENAASLYGEEKNIYSLLSDGSASMLMEEESMKGSWKETDGVITMAVTWVSKENEGEPDLSGALEMDFVYDAEKNDLHRYWKDDDADSTYHDLNFVYTRIPQGSWHMTKVYSRESGTDAVLLDPESAQSLYAESVNVYELSNWSVTETITSEDYSQQGVLVKSGNNWLLKFGEDYEMEMVYNAEENLLHRYWKSEEPQDTYHDLDFVYEQITD